MFDASSWSAASPASAVDACVAFFQSFPRGCDRRARRLSRARRHARRGPRRWLTDLLDLADATEARSRIVIDPSLARGLSYYTGAIMEIAVSDLAGSLGGGGRYDNLIGMFLGREIPACGFSLGFERIIVVMTERQMFPARVARGAVDVMVVFLADDLRGEALALADELRAERLRVDVYPRSRRSSRSR